MLQAFIITLREGVEAALIVGITLAYLAKIGRPELRKTVYYALGTAFAASLGFAVLLSRTNWNQDIFEGWIMLAAAFFVGTMIVFMMRTAKRLMRHSLNIRKRYVDSQFGQVFHDAFYSLTPAPANEIPICVVGSLNVPNTAPTPLVVSIVTTRPVPSCVNPNT